MNTSHRMNPYPLEKPKLVKMYMKDQEIMDPFNVKARRFRSWVWEYFIPTDRKTATCSLCNKVIVHGHPTSHLINHLIKVHKLTENSARQAQSQSGTSSRHRELLGVPSSSTSSSNASYIPTQQHKLMMGGKFQATGTNNTNNNNNNNSYMTETTTTTMATGSVNEDDPFGGLDYVYNDGDVDGGDENDNDDADAILTGGEDNNVAQATTTSSVAAAAANTSVDGTTKTLIEFFVSIDQPLTVFDNYRFRAFVADLNPGYALPTSSSVELDFLPELVNLVEDETRSALTANVDYVAITTKNFTSANKDYLVIMAHYIYQFEMRHRVLSVHCTNESEEKKTIDNLIQSIENDWNITNKISCIIDETTRSVRSSRFLTDLASFPCTRTLINTCVNSLLNESDEFVSKLIDKSMRLVKHVKQTGVMNNEMPLLSTAPSDPDWLSTYHAINWLVQIKPDSMTVNDASLLLTDDELKAIQSLSDAILEPLCEIYEELTNVSNVAAGFVFPAIYSFVNYELTCTRDGLTDTRLATFADRLVDSLKQTFHFVFESPNSNNNISSNVNVSSSLHKVYLCATLLDCRFKQFQFVRDERERFALLSRAKSSLVEFYCAMSSSKSPSASTTSSTSSSACKVATPTINGSDARRKPSFVEKMLNRFPANSKLELAADNSFMIELDNYIGEPSDSIQSTLEFYRMHEQSGKFPQFIRLAAFFLSLPVVTALCADEIIDYCNHMEAQSSGTGGVGINPQTLQSLVLIKSNLNF